MPALTKPYLAHRMHPRGPVRVVYVVSAENGRELLGVCVRTKPSRYWRVMRQAGCYMEHALSLRGAIKWVCDNACRCLVCGRLRSYRDAPSCLGCARDEAEKAQTV